MCEAVPLPLFYYWEPPPYVAEPSIAIPESPLFAPQKELFYVIKDPGCSEFTYDLLCDMRDLTDLFIAHSSDLETVLDVDEEASVSPTEPYLLDYDAKICEMRAKLASLPSAYTPGLPTTNDWIYEACRIAAIIYASAIIMRVPFSVAAEAGRNPILLDSASLMDPLDGARLLSTRLTEALYEAMEKTNNGSVWDDMSGVYYWVAAVGAAAARTSVTICTYQRPSSHSEAYATWVRRCLMMFATRAIIILMFQHPFPVLIAQKKLVKVQELIGGDSPRMLAT